MVETLAEDELGTPTAAPSGPDETSLGALPAYLTHGFMEPMPAHGGGAGDGHCLYGNRRNIPNEDICCIPRTVEPLAATPSKAGATNAARRNAGNQIN
ncbi:hypothetical protein CYMTET_40552 [Cymbomonas tetramitiformis]|uniref:Uncharacterized protein n=1 Tax=Cymbomonas tetramitiformis TaxID=36881 RepID=A0AAE0C7X3_9CHLO|nr:hypothetical protein CYMTET_40552 [Cymbomonas tetramitiformis]